MCVCVCVWQQCIITILLIGFMADQIWYNLESAQYL